MKKTNRQIKEIERQEKKMNYKKVQEEIDAYKLKKVENNEKKNE